MNEILSQPDLDGFWYCVTKHPKPSFLELKPNTIKLWNKLLELLDTENAFLYSYNFQNISALIECLNWFNDSHSTKYINLQDIKKHLVQWALICDYNSPTPYKIPTTYGNTVPDNYQRTHNIKIDKADQIAKQTTIGFIIQKIIDEFDTMETNMEKCSLENIHSSMNFQENKVRLDGTRHHKTTHTTEENVWTLQFSPRNKYTYTLQGVYTKYTHNLQGVYEQCPACMATCRYVLIACTEDKIETETHTNNCTISTKTQTTPLHMRILLPQ